MARPIFWYIKITFAVLFSVALTACATEESLDRDREFLSGNSFYDVIITLHNAERSASTHYNRFRFEGVLHFEENGDLRGLDHVNLDTVLEGKWHVSSIANRRVELNDVVIHTLIDGFRHEIRFNYSDVPISVDGSSRQALVSSSMVVEGFPQEAKYDVLLRKIKLAELAPPPAKPAPVDGTELVAEAAILIPLCILTAMILCM
jgi:hypothetical protein